MGDQLFSIGSHSGITVTFPGEIEICSTISIPGSDNLSPPFLFLNLLSTSRSGNQGAVLELDKAAKARALGVDLAKGPTLRVVGGVLFLSHSFFHQIRIIENHILILF